MNARFPHEAEKFDQQFYSQVAQWLHNERSYRILPSMIEKDYWVTVALQCLIDTGLDVDFKGGTSLSKGFGIITRFSEDLDLRLGSQLSIDGRWSNSSPSKELLQQRRQYWDDIRSKLASSGHIKVNESIDQDKALRSFNYELVYPGSLASNIPAPMKPFVLIEAGFARVEPSLPRVITSYVHEFLDKHGMSFPGSIPKVKCVHPAVTLFEKIDAINRRLSSPHQVKAETFIRHFEDCHAIIRVLTSNQYPVDLHDLYSKMKATKDIRFDHHKFPQIQSKIGDDLRLSLEKAWGNLEGMHFGQRQTIESCMQSISNFLYDLQSLTGSGPALSYI